MENLKLAFFRQQKRNKRPNSRPLERDSLMFYTQNVNNITICRQTYTYSDILVNILHMHIQIIQVPKIVRKRVCVCVCVKDFLVGIQCSPLLSLATQYYCVHVLKCGTGVVGLLSFCNEWLQVSGSGRNSKYVSVFKFINVLINVGVCLFVCKGFVCMYVLPSLCINICIFVYGRSVKFNILFIFTQVVHWL